MTDGVPAGDDAPDEPGDQGGETDRLLGVLSWVLETETRARIYLHLRSDPGSTSDEIAEATGLYPSTVREAVAALHGEGYLTRDKRAASGAGNNPYEYDAMPPTELVDRAAGRVQSGLNSVAALEDRLGREEAEPVEITVHTESGEE